MVTDCQALTFLNKNKTKSSQIVRWSNLLAEYEFEIKFKSGQSMKHADALSRAPLESSEGDLEDALIVKLSVYNILTREEEIILFQYTDPELKRKIELLRKKGDISASEKSENKDYILKQALFIKLCARTIVSKLYVVPKRMRKTLVIKYHDMNAHIGVDKCVRHISEYYYFPGIKNYVKRHIKMCIECILTKT